MKTVYLILGEGMGNGYVGVTSKSLHDRWVTNAHIHRAPNRVIAPLAEIPDDDVTTEGWFIEKLGTLHPKGKNLTATGMSAESGTKALHEWRKNNPELHAAQYADKPALMKIGLAEWKKNNPEADAERRRKISEGLRRYNAQRVKNKPTEGVTHG